MRTSETFALSQAGSRKMGLACLDSFGLSSARVWPHSTEERAVTASGAPGGDSESGHRLSPLRAIGIFLPVKGTMGRTS